MADGKKGNRDLLLTTLREHVSADPEQGHIDADEALLDYIGDDEVRQAFYDIDKWYA